MAKSQLERQLERMQKDSKKQASENNKRAIQQAIRDRASSIVNGQPIINGLRIMDETAEILLQCLLDLQKESGNDTFNFAYEKLPECVIAAIGLEFEKLTQYGMTAPALLWMGAGSVSILPPAKSYFDKKAESIDIKKHITKDDDNNMIFISHRSNDKEFADIFVDFLKIVGISSSNIFCSSLPGNDIRTKIDTEIKENLNKSKVDVVFLSSEYYKSAYCLNEAGIIWYNNKPTIVIALPEIDETKMLGFIDADYKLRSLNSSGDISSIYDYLKPLYNLNNEVTVLNREIDKLINKYKKLLEKRVVDAQENVVEEQNLTADEAVILYYIWKNKKRKIQSTEEVYVWLNDSEIYDIDVPNGIDLLCEDNKGMVNEDGSFALGIKQFRMLSEKKKSEIGHYIELINPHFKPSKKTFVNLWDTKECNDYIKLFVAYICEEKMNSFGDRWLAEAQVESIKTWEDKNNLTRVLSINYGTCLQTFIEQKLIYPSSYTSHGNPREYTLHKSIKEFLFSPDFPYFNEISEVKGRYEAEALPF